MDSGYLIAVLLIGAGLVGVAADEAVHRYQGKHHEIPRAANSRISWRSLMALNQQQATDDQGDGTRQGAETKHDTGVWQ
jgi:hypothetical protein